MTAESALRKVGSPIRVGVVGANPTRGWGSAAHLPALRALNEFEVTAVATTRLGTAKATAAAFGVPLAFADAGELIAHPEVEVVAVAVKVPEHDQLIRAALTAGKHVFSEWPLGVDVGQAVALADLAGEAGVRHVVGLQGYHAPGAVFVRELIESGEIGEPLSVSVVAAGGPAGRRIPEANVYATDVAAGATVLTISAGHILATLTRAVGPLRQLSAVVASINKQTTVIETGQTIPVTAPDQVMVAGRLGNGAVASIVVQGGAAPAAPGFEVRVVGAEATLTVRPATPGGIHIVDWAVSIAKVDGSSEDLPVPERFSPIPAAVPAGPPRNVALVYLELAQAIADGRALTPDFAAAVSYHQLLEAIQRASDTGARQDIAAD
jgi:predicted dehydrogenase